MNASSGKTLVLGMGNDILTDDAIGILVVRETMEMGLALLDFVVGYDTLILVDAIQTGRAAPGHIHEITPEQLKLLPDRTPHFLGVAETLLLGRRLGLAMPTRFRIFAIEVGDPFTFGTEMSAALKRALPLAVGKVLAALRSGSVEAVPLSLSGR